ncbi:hypothetical protein DER30_6811 [Streptomyces sp. HB202]|nr:hypothetical protein DER30_6811 [Streptomyces sp. HB202]
MTDALVAFLRARLDEQLEKARFASSTVANDLVHGWR